MIALAATTFPADRRFLAALYGLVLLCVAVFCQLHETFTPLVLTGAAMVVASLIIDSSRGRPLPKLVINTFLVGVALNFWREASDGESFNLMTSLGHFIIGLLICKFFERKTPRDVAQVLVLSLLIVVASTMYSTAMSFAAILVAYFGMLIYTVILLHLRMQTSEVTTRRRMPSHLLANGQHRWFARDVRMTTFRALVVLVPVALVVFLIVPRTRGGSFLMRWSAGGTFQTGFSEEVRFQEYGRLNQSDAIALEVWFYQNKVNVGAEIVDPYFRGVTLEVYNEDTGRWIHERSDVLEEVPMEEGYGMLSPPSFYSQVYPLEQVYKVAAPFREYLFHVGTPIGVSAPKQRSLLFSRRSLVLKANDRFGPSLYTIEALPRPDPTLYPADPPRRPPESDAPTAQIRELALRLVGDMLPADGAGAAPAGGAGLTPERIQAIAGRFESYLRSTYPYSLEFRREDKDLEPITDFLLNHKESGGHCEYFAAAMVMLCRSVNIEARMVTGYHGGEFNSLSNSFTVLQRHAHAWTEYYIPGQGWVHCDPSPISLSSNYSGSMWRRWMQELSQIIQNAWLSAVVTFDNESRQAIAAWFSNLLSAYQRTDIWKADLLTRLMFGLPAMGLVAVFYWAVRRIRQEREQRAILGPLRKFGRLTGDSLFMDELFRLVGRKVREVSSRETASAKAQRRPDETPLEYIAAAAPVLGPVSDDAQWLVSTFYSMRFGGISMTPALRRQIAQTMRRVKIALHPPSPKPQSG